VSGPEFYETRSGRQFYEATVPELVRQVARLADAMERVAAALEVRESSESEPEDAATERGRL
jgi:hypothetical protein